MQNSALGWLFFITSITSNVSFILSELPTLIVIIIGFIIPLFLLFQGQLLISENSNLPYIDTSKKIKDGFANGTSWTATEDCIVCGSIGFNSSAQGCNVLINGINIFWVNNDVTVNSSMPIWFAVRKGDTVRFIGYNNQVPNLTNLYAFSTKWLLWWLIKFPYPFPCCPVIKIIPDTGVVKCNWRNLTGAIL